MYRLLGKASKGSLKKCFGRAKINHKHTKKVVIEFSHSDLMIQQRERKRVRAILVSAILDQYLLDIRSMPVSHSTALSPLCAFAMTGQNYHFPHMHCNHR